MSLNKFVYIHVAGLDATVGVVTITTFYPAVITHTMGGRREVRNMG